MPPVLAPADRAFLDSARTATLATIAGDGRPRLVPICFAVADDVVWTPLDEKPKAVADVRSLARVRDIVVRPAVSLLVERSIPPLKRWARGRLPLWARSLAETQDLVQNAVLRALPHLKTFEAKHPGALQAYLRQAVSNHIRDEIRKVKARPAPSALSDDQPDEGPSPLERAIGQESLERYEAALKTLREGGTPQSC